MKFTKMHGCGNDYIYVDGAKESIPQEKKPDVVKKLSDRHFGIGGDGVIFINPSTEADFEMEMYNMDGSRAEMCGNGIRCVAKFVYDKGLTDQTHISIVSAGKVKYLDLTTEGGKVSTVKVNMGAPILRAADIPVIADREEEPVVGGDIEVDGKIYKMTCVSMGNPHAVVFMDDVEKLPIETIGPLFENHERFPKRTNTEFVHVVSRTEAYMRVWERGSAETWACGTGTCATVMACILNGKTDNKVLVHLRGGDLTIEYDEKTNHVFMTGPATEVFNGEVVL